MINASRVFAIGADCMYTEAELLACPRYVREGKPPDEAIVVSGIVHKFGFHPKRLEGYRAEIIEMLKELPDQFWESKGGGWSFLNGCHTRTGEQWGEHRDLEILTCLGQGLKLVEIPLSREVWAMLPGGLPYFVFLDKQLKEEECDGKRGQDFHRDPC